MVLDLGQVAHNGAIFVEIYLGGSPLYCGFGFHMLIIFVLENWISNIGILTIWTHFLNNGAILVLYLSFNVENNLKFESCLFTKNDQGSRLNEI